MAGHVSVPCRDQNSRLSFSPLLLVGSDAEASTYPWASCCSATPTSPENSGVAPTGFGGLMQPFFSWKDGHLNRSREAKGRREMPFSSLAQYPGKLQLENCILGALRATLPCEREFHGNFCSGFKLQLEKSLWGAQFKASDQEVPCSRDPQVSLGQHLLVWLTK